MRYPGPRLQAAANNRYLRGGLCPILLKACPMMIVISLLIQIFPLDISAQWKIMQWQPFQTRAELAPHAGKGKAVKRGKALPLKALKIRDDHDVGTDNLQPSLEGWPEVRNHYLSELPEPLWSRYLWRKRTFFALPQSGAQSDLSFSSDLFRNTPDQDDLLNRLAEGPPATVKGNGSTLYFRLSFFNRDMPHPNRNIGERDKGRLSTLEMLFQSSDMQGQPFPETMGRIFEPRIDLGIVF